MYFCWFTSSVWATASWWLDEPLYDQVLCEFISMLYSTWDTHWAPFEPEVPHSYISGVATNMLKFRGRWKTDSSIEVYIQEAMARLTPSRLPDPTLYTSLARGSEFQWQSPPSQPWTAFFDRSQQIRGWEALRRMREKLSKSCC